MSDALEVQITSPTTSEAPSTAVERPAHIPEKFWNAETGSVNTDALLASYGELEKKLGTGGNDGEQEQAATEQKTNNETPSEDPEADEALKVAEAAGLDVPALEAHWEEHGSLPDDTYEKLAKVGVDRTLVDEFVAYRVAQAETLRRELLGSVGGEEAVNRMIEWAAKSYSPEKAEAFNNAVNSKNKGQIELALKALKADYEKANGIRPKLLNAAVEGHVAGDVYASFEQLLADQRDPRYRSDPAFRNAVVAKLKRSKL